MAEDRQHGEVASGKICRGRLVAALAIIDLVLMRPRDPDLRPSRMQL